jgi:hypothetical protein
MRSRSARGTARRQRGRAGGKSMSRRAGGKTTSRRKRAAGKKQSKGWGLFGF